ncbi:MAG TPA: hypothetical protein VMC61_03755 [Methanocella sp.]|nr:hypothetical protein [Methanocella sp.]
MAAGHASARASQKAYMTAGPNTWEFMGFNATGTVGKYIVDHQGWNVSRTFGNVGIGDGSVRALNLSSNMNDINYTEQNFMAGDVSTAPWDPTRITDFSTPEEGHCYFPRGCFPHATGLKNIPEAGAGSKQENIVSDNETATTSKGEQEANKTAEVSFSGNMALRDPFHTMLLGRPVGDLLYEHPHAITANMYARLVGLRMPGGAIANIGMRAIGYGY